MNLKWGHSSMLMSLVFDSLCKVQERCGGGECGEEKRKGVLAKIQPKKVKFLSQPEQGYTGGILA